MTTLVTVTCEYDKHMQILQSASINRFVTDKCTHIIVVNDSSDISEWECLREFYTTHDLILIHCTQHKNLFLHEVTSGWYNQQLIKLNVSDLISDPYYITLDSKNIFISSVNTGELSTEGPGCTILYEHLHPNYQAWIDFLQRKLNMPAPPKLWGHVTPFTFNTSVVKQIRNQLNIFELFIESERISDLTPELYPLPSEYFLYSFFRSDHISDNSDNTKLFIVNNSLAYNPFNFQDNIASAKVTNLGRASLQKYRSEIYELLLSKGFRGDQIINALDLTSPTVINSRYGPNGHILIT